MFVEKIFTKKYMLSWLKIKHDVIAFQGVWIGVAAGFWTVTWISIGALIHPPQYPTQPMSVSGCPSNVTNFNMSSIQPAPR